MTTKAKLVSTIAAFCLVLALMVVGVLAATSATVNIGGTISFTAQDVVGSVSISSSGDQKSAISGSQSFNAENDDPLTIDLTGKALTFVKAADDTPATITVTLTIKNASTERGMSVQCTTLPALSKQSNVTLTNIKYTNGGEPTALEQGTQFTIVKATNAETPTTATITFDLVMTDANLSVSGNWTGAFTLSNPT